MTDHMFQIATLVAVIVTAIAAVAAAVGAFLNRQEIQVVHRMTNSRLDELVEATKKAAFARGASEARAEDKVEREAGRTWPSPGVSRWSSE